MLILNFSVGTLRLNDDYCEYNFSDDGQREARFKELELENERNRKVLTERIEQLQKEVETLIKEKKNDGDKEKSQPKVRSVPITNEINVVDSSTSNTEKSMGTTSSTNSIRRPTVIPAPSIIKNAANLNIKPTNNIPAASTRIQSTVSTSSSPEIPSSPVPTAAKRNFIPTRSIPNQSQSPIPSNVRSSPNNNQSSNSHLSTTTMISTIPRTSNTVGGIPRLTKTSQQITKSVANTAATGPNKRTTGQVKINFLFIYPFRIDSSRNNISCMARFLFIHILI